MLLGLGLGPVEPLNAARTPRFLRTRLKVPSGPGLVFGRTETQPFATSTLEKRAKKAWASRYACGCEVAEDVETCQEHGSARLEPIGLHECRHTFASMLIEAA